jgi:hypothetical protein
MISAISYSDIAKQINTELNSQPIRGIALDSVDPLTEKTMSSINSMIKRHCLVGILFCNPKTDFCKNEILNSLNYFHHRSKQYINFFCCGYGAYWSKNKYPDLQIVTKVDRVNWSYSDNAFVSVVEDFENRTRWRYSGENELLLLDVIPSINKNELNINNAIVCNLEKMKKDNAFSSVRSFFEDIIRYATTDDLATAWSFSDRKGGELTKDFLKNTILSFLPKPLRLSYSKAENYVIKKI